MAAELGATVHFNSLKWVKEELRQLLVEIQRHFELYLDEEDEHALTETIALLRQVRGTLSLVEVYGAALLCEEMEAVAKGLRDNAIANRAAAHEVMMSAVLRLPDYLDSLAATSRDVPMVLLPLLNDLRACRNEALMSENVLFFPDITAATGKYDYAAENLNRPLVNLALAAKKLRPHYQVGLLSWFKDKNRAAGLAKMHAVVSRLREFAEYDNSRRLWWVAQGITEALREDAVESSVSLKSLMGQVDRQIKRLSDTTEKVFDRVTPQQLTKNLLYYVARAEPVSDTLKVLKKDFQLDQYLPEQTVLEDAERRMAGPNQELLSTVSRAIRDDVNNARDILDVFSHSTDKDVDQLRVLAESLTKIGDTLGMLGLGSTRQNLLHEKQHLVEALSDGQIPGNDVLMPLAGAVISIEDDLELYLLQQERGDYAYAVPDDELSEDETLVVAEQRRVMSVLINEALKDLSRVKDSLLAFFKDTAEIEAIEQVPEILYSLGGAMFVVPLDRIQAIVMDFRLYVKNSIVNPRRVPSSREQDVIADVIINIECFLEAVHEERLDTDIFLHNGRDSLSKLGVGHNDEGDTVIAPVGGEVVDTHLSADKVIDDIQLSDMVVDHLQMEDDGHDSESAANDSLHPDSQTDAQAIEAQLTDTDETVKKTEDSVRALDEGLIEQPQPIITESAIQQKDYSHLQIIGDDADEEILDIFLEEALEEYSRISELYPLWRGGTQDEEVVKTIRRSFHTLKGSGRLVGAQVIGEFAWTHEDMFNRLIEGTIETSPAMYALLDETLGVLPQLIEQIRGNHQPVERAFELMHMAEQIAANELPVQTSQTGDHDREANAQRAMESNVVIETGMFDDEDLSDLQDAAVQQEDSAKKAQGAALSVVSDDHDHAEIPAIIDTISGFEDDDVAAAYDAAAKSVDTDPADTYDIASTSEFHEQLEQEVDSLDGQIDEFFLEDSATGTHHDDVESDLEAAFEQWAAEDDDDEFLLEDELTGRGNPAQSNSIVDLPSIHLDDTQAVSTDDAESEDTAVEDATLVLHHSTTIAPQSEFPADQLDPTLDDAVYESGTDFSDPTIDATLHDVTFAETQAQPVAEDNTQSTQALTISDETRDQAVADHTYNHPFFSQRPDETEFSTIASSSLEVNEQSLVDWPSITTTLEEVSLALETPAVTETDEWDDLINIDEYDELENADEETFDDTDLINWNEPNLVEALETTSNLVSDETADDRADMDQADTVAASPAAFIGPLPDDLTQPLSESTVADSSDATEQNEAAEQTEPLMQDDSDYTSTEEYAVNPEDTFAADGLLDIFADEAAQHLEEIKRFTRNARANPGEADSTAELIRAVHTLNGSARAARYPFIANIASALERYANQLDEYNAAWTLDDLELLDDSTQYIYDVIERLRQGETITDDDMLSQLHRRLDQTQTRVDELRQTGSFSHHVVSDDDAVDQELVEIFLEEATELVEACEYSLQQCLQNDFNDEDVTEIMRNLHTLKGGARMASLTAIGDLAHTMESFFIALSSGRVQASDANRQMLVESIDRLVSMLDEIKQEKIPASASELINRLEQARGIKTYHADPVTEASDDQAPEARTETTHTEPATLIMSDAEREAAQIGTGNEIEAIVETTLPTENEPDLALYEDFNDAVPGGNTREQSRAQTTQFDVVSLGDVKPVEEKVPAARSQELVRVQADQLDTLFNAAGEVNVFHDRFNQQLVGIGFNLNEYEQTIRRLRMQLRAMEMETEAQIAFRYEREAENPNQEFDPLEMDRYSYMQQLSRSLAESANDLENIRESIGDLVRDSEGMLSQQSRIGAELQDGLMKTRMVRFSNLSMRLRRVVRQTAQQMHKKVELDIIGADQELDRSVQERMLAPLEHMLRNAVFHGIEKPVERREARKSEVGKIKVQVDRDGSFIVLRITDDGRGIDPKAIRRKAETLGLIRADEPRNDNEVIQFIMHKGFSTADDVSQIAGRGVGMDVVDSEIKQLGGTLNISSKVKQGTVFTIRLPLTLAINQALLVQLNDDAYAIPISVIEGVVRITGVELESNLTQQLTEYEYAEQTYSMYYLGALLGTGTPAVLNPDALYPLLMVRSGDKHFAIIVDDMVGRQEIVVKPVGPQISSVPGISGATILPNGKVALILDVGGMIRDDIFAIDLHTEYEQEKDKANTPVVMVVDDSITIRKVTARVLERNNLDVVTAKDGLDAIALLQDVVPDLFLMDIEMPRMDGFELAMHVKSDSRFRHIPIIMITSRTGEKHRDRATQIGVERYLGKPFQENELMHEINELLQLEEA